MRSAWKWGAVAGALALFVAAAVAVVQLQSSPKIEDDAPAVDSAMVVTQETYDRVELGTTIQEASETIGRPPDTVAEKISSDLFGAGEVDQYIWFNGGVIPKEGEPRVGVSVQVESGHFIIWFKAFHTGNPEDKIYQYYERKDRLKVTLDSRDGTKIIEHAELF